MINVNGKTVTMTRGDTCVLSVGIVDTDGKPYIPVEGDTVKFTLKRNYSDATPLIQKNIPIDTMELVIEPDDTKRLGQGQTKGKYVYDIELTKADGTIDTFIPRGEWLILEEVG